MEETKKLLRDALRTTPELKTIPGVDALIERIPDDAEFAAANAEFEASISADIAAGLYDGFEASLEDDCEIEEAPQETIVTDVPREVPVVCNARTKQITIRLSSSVLHAVKARAKQKGVKYQTLINRVLKAVVDGWDLAESPKDLSLHPGRHAI